LDQSHWYEYSAVQVVKLLNWVGIFSYFFHHAILACYVSVLKRILYPGAYNRMTKKKKEKKKKEKEKTKNKTKKNSPGISYGTS
jgi:hypothetical protein